MSLSASVLMVRADARKDIREILELFEGKPVEAERINGWEATVEALRYPRPDRPREIVHKAATYCAGWTVVLDPEMLMVANEAACSALAKRYQAPVFGMICQGTSGTYVFSLYNPDLHRSYWIVDGEVQDDRGASLPEEAGIDLATLFEDGVLQIMGKIGVTYKDIENATEYEVWSLDESHLIPQAAPQQTKSHRPWWKIW